MTAQTPDPREEWAFLGRRVVVVARFPPAEDGIARYTDQLLQALGSEREFFRLGIPGGGGDRVRVLWGLFRPLRILLHARGVDDVLVMYHQAYFHHPWHLRRGAVRSRLASYAALLVVSRARRSTFVIHEPDDPRPEGINRRQQIAFWLEERLRRRLWASAGTLVFHTDWERRRFAERFPPGRRRDRVVTHGGFFTSPVRDSRADARRQLELPPDRVLLVLVGFLSPHKGYERVIQAMQAAGADGVELHIVGSPIAPYPEILSYVDELRRLAGDAPNVHFKEQYVSDREFDLWIRAADAVLVPYRSASSSGIVARAHLLGTTLITSGAGGIEEQLQPGDICFTTDEDLVSAIEAVRRSSAGARPPIAPSS